MDTDFWSARPCKNPKGKTNLKRILLAYLREFFTALHTQGVLISLLGIWASFIETRAAVSEFVPVQITALGNSCHYQIVSPSYFVSLPKISSSNLVPLLNNKCCRFVSLSNLPTYKIVCVLQNSDSKSTLSILQLMCWFSSKLALSLPSNFRHVLTLKSALMLLGFWVCQTPENYVGAASKSALEPLPSPWYLCYYPSLGIHPSSLLQISLSLSKCLLSQPLLLLFLSSSVLQLYTWRMRLLFSFPPFWSP